MKRILFLAFLLPFAGAWAQTPLKTTEVNVFRNGTYFIVKEGSLPLKNGTARLEMPPSPLYSTFWITPGRENPISRLIFLNDTIRKSRPAKQFSELLKANTGKKIKALYGANDKDLREVSGLLLGYFPETQLARIKTPDNRSLFFSVANLKELELDNPTDQAPYDSLAWMGRIEFVKDLPVSQIKLVYFHPGIQWVPSYSLKLLNDSEVQIEMRALIENAAEAIETAELKLTLGDPEFRYGRAVELFAQPTFNTSTYAISSPEFYNGYNPRSRFPQAEALMQQADKGGFEYEDYQDYQVVDANGEKTNDLFVYKIGKVSIPRFSKTSFQVFSQKITYQDIYEVTISDNVNYWANRYIQNDPNQKFPVFHSLRLTNATKYPLTSGPAFIQDQALQPLAQSEIAYTPINSEVSVNLAKAPDVIVKSSEEELKRDEGARTIDKTTFTKVEIRGTIPIRNNQEKNLVLTVRKQVTAEVLELSNGGKATRSGRILGLNPSTEIKWEVPLAPGQKVDLTYTYAVFVPSK